MAQTIGSIDLASLKNLRDDVTQYFWFESNSSSAWGSGAHVTLYPESQFTNPSHANYMKGQNIIMNTDGFSIRNGALPMMVLDNNSLKFNAVDTSLGTYTTMATFGLTGATIGQTNGAHIQISSSGLDVNANSSTNIARFGINGAQIGVDEKQRLELNQNGIKGYNNDDVSFFDVSYDAGSTYIYRYVVYTLPISTAVSFSDNQPHTIMSKQWNLELDSWITSFKLGWMYLRFKRYDTGVVWTGVSEETNVSASIDDDDITVELQTDGTSLTVGTSATYIASAVISSAVDSIKITLEFTYDASGGTVSMAVIGQRMTTDGRTLKISNYIGNFELAIPDKATTAPALTFGLRGDSNLGKYSVRMGESLNAENEAQTVIGTFNDNQSDTVFEIGNGKHGARSNAFTVGWNGDIEAKGTITASNHSSPIGTIVNEWLKEAVSVPDSTYTGLFSFNLDAGVWVVTCGLRFPQNTTGRRQGNIAQTSGEAATQIQIPPVNGGITQTIFTRILTVSVDGTSYYLNAWQNSGGALSMPASGDGYGNYIRAVRIA